jgi:TorA maturation chaperone TorD
VNIQEFIPRERMRGDCFRLLAACFYQPQKELFVQENLFKNLTLLLHQVCPEAAVFSDKMESAAQLYSNEELMIDYAKLFVGPAGPIAPPYGSVFLEKERKVMGNSTMEVIKMYREEGLSIDDNFKELPDHIAVELEFMYYLIFREIEAVERSDHEKASYLIEVQERFHQRFLAKWVKPFCDKITEGADNEFYRSARCLSTFILKSVIPEDLR